MVKQLRVHIALPDDLGLVPTTQIRWVATTVTLTSGDGSDTLADEDICIHVLHTLPTPYT